MFNIKIFLIISSVFLLAMVLWQYSQNRTVSLKYLDQEGITHTLTLPVKDKKRLSGLMQKLFAEDNFAYTILGPKPVSWATYLNPVPLSSWTRCDKYHRTLRSGWKTWEKYQHLFPAAHLVAESSKCHPGWVSILLINRPLS